jgi:hypothetical protein
MISLFMAAWNTHHKDLWGPAYMNLLQSIWQLWKGTEIEVSQTMAIYKCLLRYFAVILELPREVK